MPDSKPPEHEIDEVTALRRRVEDLERLWTKFEGAGMLVKMIFWIGGPAYGFYLFLKDHWKP